MLFSQLNYSICDSFDSRWWKWSWTLVDCCRCSKSTRDLLMLACCRDWRRDRRHRSRSPLDRESSRKERSRSRDRSRFSDRRSSNSPSRSSERESHRRRDERLLPTSIEYHHGLPEQRVSLQLWLLIVLFLVWMCCWAVFMCQFVYFRKLSSFLLKLSNCFVSM